MISARLQGGLCNVLFQIAAVEALALRNGDTTVFDLEGCYTPLQGNKASRYRDNVLRNVREGTFDPEAYYKEPCHTFVPIPYQNGLLIDGYFQDFRYFADYEDEIKQLFYLEDFRDKVGDLTAIHVRRGDYGQNPLIFPLCTREYYDNAAKLIGGKFMVFSDDIEWCKENIVGSNVQYSDGKSEVDDLAMMASCKNVIGANSTFSLMAAILNKNNNIKAIFPKVWFGPLGPDGSTIVPNRFIRL